MRKRQKRTLGQRLREARESRGLTQTAAAEALDTTQPYISWLEGDKREPSVDFLRKMAKVYRVRLSEFTLFYPDRRGG